jgi:hypothetical protein
LALESGNKLLDVLGILLDIAGVCVSGVRNSRGDTSQKSLYSVQFALLAGRKSALDLLNLVEKPVDLFGGGELLVLLLDSNNLTAGS